MSNIREINTYDIVIDNKQLDKKVVSILMETIKEIGLLHPITITTDLKIIAGRHRLAAVKKLGLKTILCNILSFNNSHDKEICELDENLARKKIDYKLLSTMTFRRKELHELKYPQTQQGISQGQGNKKQIKRLNGNNPSSLFSSMSQPRTQGGTFNQSKPSLKNLTVKSPQNQRIIEKFIKEKLNSYLLNETEFFEGFNTRDHIIFKETYLNDCIKLRKLLEKAFTAEAYLIIEEFTESEYDLYFESKWEELIKNIEQLDPNNYVKIKTHTEVISDITGESKSSVEKSTKIGKMFNDNPKTLEIAEKIDLKKTEALKLARKKPEDQNAFVKDVEDKLKLIEEKAIPSVKEYIKEKKPKLDEAVKLVKLDDDIQQQVIDKLNEKKVKKVSSALNQIKHDKIKKELKEKALESKEILGEIKQGDFFDQIKNVKDNSVDLLFVDPPYGILKEDWDTFDGKQKLIEFTEKWLLDVIPKVKSSGRIYICFSQWYELDLWKILEKHDYFGFICKQKIIWYYRNVNEPSDRHEYRYVYEPIFYLYGEDAPELNFDKETYGDPQTNVWTIATPQSNFKEGKFHPAQKPLELLKNIIKTGSKIGDLVLDPFAGVLTTGVICEQLNRKYILIEQDKNYIELGKGRIKSV